jgi:hypothetical protein
MKLIEIRKTAIASNFLQKSFRRHYPAPCMSKFLISVLTDYVGNRARLWRVSGTVIRPVDLPGQPRPSAGLITLRKIVNSLGKSGSAKITLT